MEQFTEELRELYEKAKSFQTNTAPSPSYANGRTDGFYQGVRYVFEKIAEQDKIPLTMEQLREMDGEPVWVISLDGQSEPCWMLVDAEYELCREAHGGLAIFDTYGKTWLAYRRKPEEGI